MLKDPVSRCKLCRKYPIVIHYFSSNPMASSNVPHVQIDRWTCAECTRSNSTEDLTCQCGLRRGNWRCASCLKVVGNIRLHCQCVVREMCSNPDWYAAAYIVNDWKCPKCGDVQYAIRTSCSYCPTQKSADASTVSSPTTRACVTPKH